MAAVALANLPGIHTWDRQDQVATCRPALASSRGSEEHGPQDIDGPRELLVVEVRSWRGVLAGGVVALFVPIAIAIA
jgi:hypothetical protein